MTMIRRKVKRARKPAPSNTGYGSMSRDELREECASRGLSTSGTKADMVTRLEEYDAQIDENQ